uniref:Uncharacterized protein n=1 Tax=Arundo donax TaxID=35708 RepID=A0A0A9C4J6_ARUDO
MHNTNTIRRLKMIQICT